MSDVNDGSQGQSESNPGLEQSPPAANPYYAGQAPTQAPPVYQAATAAAPDPNVTAKIAALHRRAASGANWFYWIAGLSIINSIGTMSGGKFFFPAGLGVTEIVSDIAKHIGGPVMPVCLVFNLVIAAVYAMFGYFAARRAMWAFVTGIAFYALDTVIFLLAQDVFGIALHAFALFCVFNGFKAARAAAKLGA